MYPASFVGATLAVALQFTPASFVGATLAVAQMCLPNLTCIIHTKYQWNTDDTDGADFIFKVKISVNPCHPRHLRSI